MFEVKLIGNYRNDGRNLKVIERERPRGRWIPAWPGEVVLVECIYLTIDGNLQRDVYYAPKGLLHFWDL